MKANLNELFTKAEQGMGVVYPEPGIGKPGK